MGDQEPQGTALTDGRMTLKRVENERAQIKQHRDAKTAIAGWGYIVYTLKQWQYVVWNPQ